MCPHCQRDGRTCEVRESAGGDCRVVLLSHETGEEEREWGSVAEFLEEVLTAPEEG